MSSYLKLGIFFGLCLSVCTQAAEPVICSGYIRDLATGSDVGVQNDGVFDADQKGEFGYGMRAVTIAESDGYQVTLHRAFTSGVLKTPEISITLRRQDNLGKRLAVALGENHALMIYEDSQKYIQLNCYENARFKAHNDGLCGNPESAKPQSQYRKTCETLCQNIPLNFSSDSICAPYLRVNSGK
jgi:hypothetical protein